MKVRSVKKIKRNPVQNQNTLVIKTSNKTLTQAGTAETKEKIKRP